MDRNHALAELFDEFPHARFNIDLKADGMLTVVVAHPPRFGAKLADVNDRAARAVPGVVDVRRLWPEVVEAVAAYLRDVGATPGRYFGPAQPAAPQGPTRVQYSLT